MLFESDKAEKETILDINRSSWERPKVITRAWSWFNCSIDLHLSRKVIRVLFKFRLGFLGNMMKDPTFTGKWRPEKPQACKNIILFLKARKKGESKATWSDLFDIHQNSSYKNSVLIQPDGRRVRATSRLLQTVFL